MSHCGRSPDPTCSCPACVTYRVAPLPWDDEDEALADGGIGARDAEIETLRARVAELERERNEERAKFEGATVVLLTAVGEKDAAIARAEAAERESKRIWALLSPRDVEIATLRKRAGTARRSQNAAARDRDRAEKRVDLLREIAATREAERDSAVSRADVADVACDAFRVLLAAAIARAERAERALAKIDAIRNSIVGCQSVHWSMHIYPLVEALGEAGIEGEGYEVARARAQAEVAGLEAIFNAETAEQRARAERAENGLTDAQRKRAWDEAGVTGLADQRNAAIERAERAEADRDAPLLAELRALRASTTLWLVEHGPAPIAGEPGFAKCVSCGRAWSVAHHGADGRENTPIPSVTGHAHECGWVALRAALDDAKAGS